MQEIVLLQTQYTDRFFQLCRLEGGFCMMSASLLIRLDEAGAETSRQSLDAKDGWSFAAIQEADGVLYVLTRNFYGEELPRGRWVCCRVGAGRVRLMERLIFPPSSPMTMTLTVWPSVRYSCRSLT